MLTQKVKKQISFMQRRRVRFFSVKNKYCASLCETELLIQPPKPSSTNLVRMLILSRQSNTTFMERLVTSHLKLGIIAGGQLGKMLVQEASKWDISTFVLDKEKNCPAGSIATVFQQGDPLNYDDVYNFGKKVETLTFEIENINVEALHQLKLEINPRKSRIVHFDQGFKFVGVFFLKNEYFYL